MAGSPGSSLARPADGDAGHPSVLPLTGERTVPGIAQENYWFPDS